MHQERARVSLSALLLWKYKVPCCWAGHNDIEDDVVVVDDAVERNVVPVDPVPPPDYPEETNYISDYTTDYQEYSEYNNVEEDSEYNTVADYDYTDQASDIAVTGGDSDVDGYVDGDVGGEDDGDGVGVVCPGGDLYTCIDVCPGQFGARVFGLCVASCGRRCP